MSLRSQVSKKIKAVRIEKKLSQQELARRSGYTYQYISKFESEPSNLSLDAIERLARALNVEPSELLSKNGLVKVSNQKTIKEFDQALEVLGKVRNQLISD